MSFTSLRACASYHTGPSLTVQPCSSRPHHNSRHETHVSAFTKSFAVFASGPCWAQPQTYEFQQSWRQPALSQSSPLMCTLVQHQRLSGVQEHSDKHALGHDPKAQCAFKILMIHEVLQFALRIAFRCVLHRCGIQDIHC